jgi:hypothetical protein
MLFEPASPELLVAGGDFILRMGRAQPRVTVLPARPPGMRRRDLIGIKLRLRITAARRRAVPVVACMWRRSSSAAVLMASLSRTAAATLLRQGSWWCASNSARASANFPRSDIEALPLGDRWRLSSGTDPPHVSVPINLGRNGKGGANAAAAPLHGCQDIKV